MCVDNKPQKRPHKKSRLGCNVCKARKIKCDEVRPICGNCARRFPNPEEECDFLFAHTRQSAARSTRKPTLNVGLSSRPSHSSNRTSRSMELRLFHHYATITGYTLPLSEEHCGVNMWTKSIPSIAFDCQHVYSAVLSLAAMHLLSLTPNDLSIRAAMYQYLNETISSQREEVTSITTTNSVLIFTTSMLLATHSKLRAISLATSDESYTPPLDWFYLHAGVREVSRKTLSHIEDSDIRAYAFLNPESDATLSLIPGSPVDFPDDPFLRLWDEPSVPPERREIYSQALKYLELLKSRIKAGEKSHWIQRRFALIPGEVPKGFVGLIEEDDPLALAILARFFALLKYVEEPWWVKGTAEFEIRGLAGLVSEDLEWSMRWPLEILEVCS